MTEKEISKLNKTQLQEKCTELQIAFEADDSKKNLLVRLTEKLKLSGNDNEQEPVETRGRKPKELSVEDLQNKAKELILDINAYIKIKAAKGKNCYRLRSAATDIQRMVKNSFID